MATNNQIVVVGQPADPISIGFIPVMILCGFVALVVTHFWQILTVSAVLLATFLLYRASTIEKREERALRARADRQNAEFLATGDLGVRDETVGQR